MKQEAHFSILNLRMFSQALASVSASAEAPHLQILPNLTYPQRTPANFQARAL
jgi:hypothetical protein